MSGEEQLAALVRLKRSRAVTPEERRALIAAIEALAEKLGLPIPKDDSP